MLLPFCSGIEAAVQVASVTVPLSCAVPLPPRSLDQRTRYSRMLSLAWPLRPTEFALESPICLSICTAGAILSSERQRRRSACAISESSRMASSAVAAGSSLPPQPASASTVKACATAQAERLIFIVFIPNVPFDVSVRRWMSLCRPARYGSTGSGR
ncbi:MAG: hypothetical protein QM722_10775 [Piscinibacter sp.]